MYMNENISSKQIIFMIVGLSLLIVFVLVSYFLSNKNYDHVKVDSSQNFVFKRNSDYSGTDKNVPYINVEGTAASEYNAVCR